MPHINSNRRKPAARRAVAVLALLLACLGLAACGGSSKSSTSTASASATTSTTGGGATGPGATGAGVSRFKALRECLQKNGVTLPQRAPGQRRPGGPGGFLGGAGGTGGPRLPSGVSRAQYEAALKKCGGGTFVGSRGARFQSPAFKAALTKFAACMRENGVHIPEPNTSGSGPIFDTKGIDTSSSQFRTAESKCRTDLTSAFRRPNGAGGGAPGGAPTG